MNPSHGIEAHLATFLSSEFLKADQPTTSLLTTLKTLTSIIESKEVEIHEREKLCREIKKQISYQEALELKECKKSIENHDKMLKVIEICQEIDKRIVEFEDGIEMNDYDELHRLKVRLNTFRELYLLVETLDEEFANLGHKKERTEGESIEKDLSERKEIEELRTAYFLKLKSRFYKAIIELFYSHNRNKKITESLEYFHLPIKKAKTKEDEEKELKIDASDPNYLEHAYSIIEALFCEYCCYCLQKKIELILGKEEEEGEFGKVKNDALNEEAMIYFISPFFTRIWGKIEKSLTYIFIEALQINQENNAYQIDEPQWMFEYMEEIFKFNYFYVLNNILQILKVNPETKEIAESISTYFITYNFKHFFMKFVHMRLESDLKILKEDDLNQKKSEIVREKSSFIIFNFLDELHILEEKLHELYTHEAGFVESVLVWAEKSAPLDLLALNFDYEHQWIEERIFNDFYNINYSNITDLKNVEAYNITVNFTHIFEKLYSKFRRVSDEGIKNRIDQFYYDELLRLVRHIKTSFERIYNNSGIDKFETLMSYKKVEDEFRGYFEGFIGQSPTFELKIKDEYYSTREQYTSVFALEELTGIHRKVYKRFSECSEIFSGKGKDLENFKIKWNKIFEEWQEKLQKIRNIQNDYEDKKMRNIFFVFLESIEFSEDGYCYFISLFEPFLVVLFAIEGTKTLKMILEMDKGTFHEYCKSQQASLWFLNSNELRSIEKFKVKTGNLSI